MAGPITGNNASANGRGSLRTDAVTAISIEGASALESCGSVARRAMASGSTRLTSRVCTDGSSMCAWSAVRSRRSGPTSSDRSSERLSSTGSAPACPWPFGLRSRSPPASGIAGLLNVRHLEVVGQAHRHLGEQRRQRGAVGFVAAQRLRFVRERGEHFVHLLADVVAETLVLLEDLLAQLALALRRLVVERGDAARERRVGFHTIVVVRFQMIGQRLHFLLRVLLERLD